jgi:ABC-2 type transport system permease protein
MFYTFDIYRRLLGVQFRSQLQYRVSFLFDLLSTGLVVVFEFGSIALVLERFGHIRGWTLGEVAFLYGLAETAFGIMDMVFSGFDPPYFGRHVRRGTLDQLMLRPVNLTVQVLGSEFALRRIGRIVMGIAILALAVDMTGLSWTPVKVLYLPLVLLGMVCFFGGLFIIGSSITFWTVESIEVLNILTYGGSFVISYPMHIYQDWMRRFFTFVVPAIFLTYYPSLYFLEKPDPFNFPQYAPFLSPLVGFMVLAVALVFWKYALRYYRSTGT